MLKIYEVEDFKFFIDEACVDYATRRAGNPHYVGSEINETYPKSIDRIAQAKIGSGHDCFLKGVIVYIDIWASKVFREQLLRYNHLDVVSSSSLMHNVERWIKVDRCWEEVDKDIREFYNEWAYSKDTIEKVNNLPMGFKYPISVVTNYLQLKTIYTQRKAHKLFAWKSFCSALVKLPNHEWITGKDVVVNNWIKKED